MLSNTAIFKRIGRAEQLLKVGKIYHGKCLKVEYLGQIIYNFEKYRYTYHLDYKDSASTKK
jgi:hypothetical protein